MLKPRKSRELRKRHLTTITPQRHRYRALQGAPSTAEDWRKWRRRAFWQDSEQHGVWTQRGKVNSKAISVRGGPVRKGQGNCGQNCGIGVPLPRQRVYAGGTFYSVLDVRCDSVDLSKIKTNNETPSRMEHKLHSLVPNPYASLDRGGELWL